jgi:hypothetical protein
MGLRDKGGAGRRRHRPIQWQSYPRCPGCFGIRGSCAAVLKVRIHLPPGESHTNFQYLSGGVLSAAGNIRPDPYGAGTDERLRNPRQRIDAPASIVTKARHYPWFFESEVPRWSTPHHRSAGYNIQWRWRARWSWSRESASNVDWPLCCGDSSLS